jgi:hypothetical protein
LGVWVISALAGSANAAELYKVPGTTVEFNVEVGFGNFNLTEDYSPKNRSSVHWSEGYAIAGFKFDHALSDRVKLFGAISGIANGNRGDGDALGATLGFEDGGQLHQAYAGISWTSGKEGGPAVKISGGRQATPIGDWLVIGTDGPTSGVGFGARYDEGGSWYLNPRRPFAETALVQVETGTPIRFDAFYVASEKAWQGETSVAGLNTEYVDAKLGKLGFMYVKGLDVENNGIIAPGTMARDGMDLYSLSGSSSLGVKDLNVAFNYIIERNDSPPVGAPELDATAWYALAGYKFSNLKWTPSVEYRFASFSGDDPNTPENEAYDTLFWGFPKYNTWFMGEIAANYAGPFNSNADVHSITINSAPNIDVGIGTWTGLGGYVNHYSMREDIFNATTLSFTPNTSGDFGTEVAIFSEFVLFEGHLWVSPLYSVYFPDEAYKNFYNKDDTVQNLQLMAIYTY